MEKISKEDIMHLYGMDAWGKNYFSVNDQGHLVVETSENENAGVDVYNVIEDLKIKGLNVPCVLRFPQVLERRVKKLYTSFHSSMDEFGYQGSYAPVFPIKVNQHKTVVETLIKAGNDAHLGIEAGSKPELITALGQDVSKKALTICNGFKDQSYFDLASIGVAMGRKIVVVIEKPFELKYFLKLKEQGKPLPMIGFRIKLQAKGSGLWEKSGGAASKFGLSTLQLIQSIEWLADHGLTDQLQLLHFHIGSQITEIRKIKAAMREAARVYAKVQKMDLSIKYLDVGGGLGVDHDGSKTSSDASVNYTIGEYANDVVYTIKEVCDQEGVKHPIIVTESGRALTTHHSLLVMEATEIIRETQDGYVPKATIGNDPSHHVIEELAYIHDHITVKNFREYYHDAVEKKDQLQSLFNLGMFDIEQRARGEWLYNGIARKAIKFSKSAKFVAEEFVELEEKMHSKIVCNFSVFQSAPDHWALDQLFPIVPIHRLLEKPSEKATIVDITCDSDGEIEKFVDLKDIKEALEIHTFDSASAYYIGILMVGAYQDTMGNEHNMFGSVHDIEVRFENGQTLIGEIQKGETNQDTIEMFGYKAPALIDFVEKALKGNKAGHAEDLLKGYQDALGQYTYLSPSE